MVITYAWRNDKDQDISTLENKNPKEKKSTIFLAEQTNAYYFLFLKFLFKPQQKRDLTVAFDPFCSLLENNFFPIIPKTKLN